MAWHVVIVGGGFAGLAAARGLRGEDVRITLIDRTNHFLFQPLLYQVATAALAPSDIAEPLRGVLAGQANVEVRMADVTGVDVGGKRVLLAGEEPVAYDFLVLAAGARTSWFGHDRWAAHAPGLKSLADALDLRRRVLSALEAAEWCDEPDERARLLRFVVVGGGPTGVEVAGALAEMGRTALRQDFRHLDPAALRVVLVEGSPAVLGHLDPPLREAARAQLVELGVEVRTGCKVEDVDEHGLLVDGERLTAGAVLWAAGVAASPLGAALGAPCDRSGRVIVNPDCTLPGHPEVFVVGDLASWSHGVERPLPGVAPVAVAMGAHAAASIRATLRQTPTRPLRYVDKGSMATVGYRRAVVQAGPLRMAGTLAWVAWVFVHLMTLVGHRSRVVVFVKWAWAWLWADRSSRLLFEPARARSEDVRGPSRDASAPSAPAAASSSASPP